MAIRYLRRPPKPVERKMKRGAGKRPPPMLSRTPVELDAAYFCVMCGCEHASGGAGDRCTAPSPFDAVTKPARP
jgi:hypothetical protein